MRFLWICSLFMVLSVSANEPVNTHNWRAFAKDPAQPGVVTTPTLALPSTKKPLHLSVREAILLSLRNNPNIRSADLGRVMDKFSLLVAHNAYMPQFTLGGQSNWVQGASSVYTANAGVNLNTRYGTQFGVNYNNTLAGGGGPAITTFSITQPLLQGFGRKINEIPWLNALDSENISRLNFKGTMMAQVVGIVNSYYQLMQDYQNLEIDAHTLKNTKRMVDESRLRYKVGQLAKSDLLQQKATYETTQLSLLRQKSALISDYQAFLTTLGLEASAKIEIDRQVEMAKIKIPTLKEAIALALKGNVAYQQQLIALRATKRSVLSAKDAARWQLNLTGNYAMSGNSSIFQFLNTSGASSTDPFNVQNNPSLIASLSVPINNMPQKQAVLNTSLQLEQAKLQLDNIKDTLIRQVTNQVQQLENAVLALQVAERQVKFQRANLAAAQIKYRYGRSTAFELNQLQDQLLSQETALVAMRVSLLNQVEELNQLFGRTLEQWQITLRY